MAHAYRNYSPEQGSLFPQSPRDWLPEDCLAYQVYEIVSELDLSKIHAAYSKDGRGAPAFDPKMMVAVLLYAHYKGIASSRAIKRLCVEDVGARFLTGGDFPDHRSIHAFRKLHKEAMRDLFLQSVRMCQAAGMAPLKKVAIDGTKIAGAASKESNLTYASIVKEEERLAAQFDADLQAALDADAAQDTEFGADHDGYSLPEPLKSRQDRIALLRKGKAALQERAREREQERKAKWDNTDPKERPHRKKPDPDSVVPQADDRYNFVDPQSRMMKGRGKFVQGYNAQIGVDSAHQVIVACAVTDACTDYCQLIPLAQQTTQNLGVRPDQFLADGGYFDHQNIDTLEAQSYSLLIPPDNSWRQDTPISAPLTDEECQSKTTRERLAHTMTTEQGRLDYSARMKTVEPVFAQIKGSPGHTLFTQFLRHGLEQAAADWSFVCAAYNIRKLLRFRHKPATVGLGCETSTAKVRRRIGSCAATMVLEGI